MDKIKEIINYYDGKKFVIVGLNDLIHFHFYWDLIDSNFIEKLTKKLSTDKIHPLLIDACSVQLNHTQHVNYLLKANYNMEEIKWLKIYAMMDLVEKYTQKYQLPEILKYLGKLYQIHYKPSMEDKEIHMIDSIMNAYEPLIIYTSGFQNLLTKLRYNKNYSKKILEKNNFSYHFFQEQEISQKIIEVMGEIKVNIETLRRINPCSDIYIIGGFLPQKIYEGEKLFFENITKKYNASLEIHCKEYGVTYLNPSKVPYDLKRRDFSEYLSNILVEAIYQNKISEQKVQPNLCIEKTQMMFDKKSYLYDLIQEYHDLLSEEQPGELEQQWVQKIAQDRCHECDIIHKVRKKVLKTERLKEKRQK